MKSVNCFDLLLEARKYTNRSVIRAFMELADELADFGKIKGETPAYYGEFRMLVQMELDGTTEENRNETYKFESVSEFAKELGMTEEEMLQELTSCGLLISEDETPDFKLSGILLEAIDKGLMKVENEVYYISPAGKRKYLRWKERGGETLYSLPMSGK